MPRLADTLRISAVLLGAAASIATSRVEPGDRAGEGGTPSCPAGETCSDATPEGLYFAGTPTGDQALFGSEWPKATALGGTQEIRLYLDEDATRPLDLPFEATLGGDALSVARQADASVTVAGEQAGAATLRIVEPGTDLLYDRLSLEAREVSRFELIPSGRYLWWDTALWSQEYGVAVHAGGEARLTVAMYAGDGERVIDDKMQLEGGPEVSADPLGFVDTVRVAPGAAGPLEISVRAGDRVASLPLRAVAAAEQIVSLDGALPLTVSAGGARTVCFRAEHQGDLVLGGAWRYQVGSRATLAKLEEEDAAQCIKLLGAEEGTDTLSVSAAGASAEFPLEVTPPGADAAARPADPLPPTLGGDRASPRALF